MKAFRRRPPRCWDGDVYDDEGRPVAFGRWILNELTHRHREVVNRRHTDIVR